MATMHTYEGMFVMDATASEFEPASEQIRNVLSRSKADILAIKPWDDRRLAYEIQGRRRALYVLAYFQADPSVLTEIEHDCRLNESVLRVLILRQEQVGKDLLETLTPAEAKIKEAEARAAAEEAKAEEAKAADKPADKTDTPTPTPQAEAKADKAPAAETAPAPEAKAENAPADKANSGEDKPAG